MKNYDVLASTKKPPKAWASYRPSPLHFQHHGAHPQRKTPPFQADPLAGVHKTAARRPVGQFPEGRSSRSGFSIFTTYKNTKKETKMKFFVMLGFALMAVVAYAAEEAKEASKEGGDRPKVFRRLIPADQLRGKFELTLNIE